LDDENICCGFENGEIRILNLKSNIVNSFGKKLEEGISVRNMIFSEDLKRYITIVFGSSTNQSDRKRQILVRDLASSKELLIFEDALRVRFVDENRIVVLHKEEGFPIEKRMYIQDMNSGEKQYFTPPIIDSEMNIGQIQLSYSPILKMILVSNSQGMTMIKSDNTKWEHLTQVSVQFFSSDGKYIIFSTRNNQIKLFAIQTRKESTIFTLSNSANSFANQNSIAITSIQKKSIQNDCC